MTKATGTKAQETRAKAPDTKKASTARKAASTAGQSLSKSSKIAKDGNSTHSASALIDSRIRELADWRGDTLASIRDIIKRAVPDVIEEVKWGGVPVWSYSGIICTGETYKAAVKMTFAKGASLEDPEGIFNASLEGNTRRAIDIREDEKINEDTLTALLRAAAALNTEVLAERQRRARLGRG